MATNPRGRRSRPLTEFKYFSLLPAELRIEIWHASFRNRVVELHRMPVTYRDENGRRTGSGLSPWQSHSSNPAALSTCAESRELAQKYFALPLSVSAPKPKGGSGELCRRTLYLNPESDLVVALGMADYLALGDLFDAAQAQDPARRRIRRLALTVSCWLQNFQFESRDFPWDKLLFSVHVDELVLLAYNSHQPPNYFRDGECAINAVGATYKFPQVSNPTISERFRNDGLTITTLNFIPGPVSRRAIGSFTVKGPRAIRHPVAM
ncbi:Putative ATP-dependent RNA helicase ucp12 [Hypoxylon texense]